MPSRNMSDIEKAHNLKNIRAQLLEGKHRTLPNVRVLKVFKKATPSTFTDHEGSEKITYGEAFPPGDYKWWHHPAYGDGEFAILISLAVAATYERLLKRPRENQSFTYEFEMEEIRIDLMMLTNVELARFQENSAGEAAVLRFIAEPVKAQDEMTKMARTIRVGYVDTVRIAEYSDKEAVDVGIALKLVGAGMYEFVPWKDVPLSYIKDIVSGRMGAAFHAQQMDAKAELQRREGLKAEAAETVVKEPEPTEPPESEPPAPIEPVSDEDICAGISTTTGQRCKRKATVRVDGRWYCKTHGDVAKKKAVPVGGEV